MVPKNFIELKSHDGEKDVEMARAFYDPNGRKDWAEIVQLNWSAPLALEIQVPSALISHSSSLWWALLFGNWCWCFHHSIDNITSIFLGLWRFFFLNDFHPNPRSIRPQRGSCCVGRGGWLFAWSWCERPSRGSSNPGPAGACCDRLGPRDGKSENEMHNTDFFLGWGGVDVSYCAKIGWMYLRSDIAKLEK